MADEEYDFDPWETSTGLPDEITVRVENPRFGFDAQLQDGKACAFFMEGTITEGAADDEREFSQWYTVGKGWEVGGKGTRLIPESGKKHKLNNSTNYAHLFKTLKTAAEAQGMWDELRKRGNPFESELWQDLELFLKREEVVRTIGGERSETTRLNVERIVSMPGVTGSRSQIRSAPEEREATAESSSNDSASNGADLSPKTKVELRKLAEKIKADGGTHSQFAEAAFSDVEGVLENKAAEDAVMDQADGSIWASA